MGERKIGSLKSVSVSKVLQVERDVRSEKICDSASLDIKRKDLLLCRRGMNE